MASYDSGPQTGGKFRKRLFRRAPAATPYDRPQTALRTPNPNPNPNPISGNNGWLSKIVVNPASRILAWSASRIFSSSSEKRLGAPPPQPPSDENLFRDEAPEAVKKQISEPSDAAIEQDGNAGENASNNHSTERKQKEALSGADGFLELEQLLKQKTFTRAESDHLRELLRSRTVEPSTSPPTVNYEEEAGPIIIEQVKDNKWSAIEPKSLQQPVSYERKGKTIVSEQGVKFLDLHDHKENAVNLDNPEKEDVLPAEIAKEYMDSRPSKVSPSTLSIRNRIFREDTILPTVPYTKKPSALLPSNSFHFSGIPEQSENGYMTPRPRGRSALYRMSRSPYFKTNLSSDIRGRRPLRDGIGGPSTSPLRPSNVLKRGSSALDIDSESFTPMRRIRQRSNLSSPYERDSSAGNFLHTLPDSLDHDSAQKSLRFSYLKCKDAENQENTNSFASVVPVPSQSTEMARKIFQALDKLVPSPGEKTSVRKDNGSMVADNDSPLLNLKRSSFPKQGGFLSQNTEMTTAEESVELDTSKDRSNVPGLSPTGNDKVLKKSLASPSKSKPANKKRVNFLLPAETACTSQPTTTPLQPEKEPSASASKQGSEDLPVTTAICGSLESGVSSTPTKARLENSVKRDETPKAVDLCTPVKPNSSGLPTSTSPGLFGSSIVPNQSNGSIRKEPVTVASEGNSLKPSPFTFSSSIIAGPSTSFPNTDISVFSSTGVSSNTSAAFSSVPDTVSVPSALSTSTTLSISSTLTNSANGIFSFSASTQSNSASSSASTFGGTSGNGSTSLPHSSAVQFGLKHSSSLGSENLPAKGNDQRNVEDGIATDNIQVAAPLFSGFGQRAQSPSVGFVAPAATSGQSIFQFGSHHNSTAPLNMPPFQGSGNQEFPTGGNFTAGSAGDKSGRRIIRVKRDKPRRK